MANVGTYRDKSPDELADELVKLKKERFNLRFQRASGQLEKTNRVREVRRDIARVLTVIGQKARGETAPARKAKLEKKKSPTKAAAKSRAKAKK